MKLKDLIKEEIQNVLGEDVLVRSKSSGQVYSVKKFNPKNHEKIKGKAEKPTTGKKSTNNSDSSPKEKYKNLGTKLKLGKPERLKIGNFSPEREYNKVEGGVKQLLPHLSKPLQANFKKFAELGIKFNNAHIHTAKQKASYTSNTGNPTTSLSFITTGKDSSGNDIAYYKYEGNVAGGGQSFMILNGSRKIKTTEYIFRTEKPKIYDNASKVASSTIDRILKNPRLYETDVNSPTKLAARAMGMYGDEDLPINEKEMENFKKSYSKLVKDKVWLNNLNKLQSTVKFDLKSAINKKLNKVTGDNTISIK